MLDPEGPIREADTEVSQILAKNFAHLRCSKAHCQANGDCRRQIEKSPLTQIEMSLSTVFHGEHWADDGDYALDSV